MSFPPERTENLLRFETGQAVAQSMLAGTSLGVGSILIAFGRKPGGVEKAFGLPPHYRFTWGHAVGYPLEGAEAGGQRPRLRFDRLFHDNAFGVPLKADPEVDAVLGEVGMIQPQSPAPDRFDELDRLADRFGRDRGELRFPAREIRRLIDDDDWDFGPAIRRRAEEVIAEGGLPEYPDEMRETFTRLLEEHGIDSAKYLPE